MNEQGLEIGKKVHYKGFDKNENGIIKSWNENKTVVFVVYRCRNDWKNFANYTGQSTDINDLYEGWT